jgi:hypothetical protein
VVRLKSTEQVKEPKHILKHLSHIIIELGSYKGSPNMPITPEQRSSHVAQYLSAMSWFINLLISGFLLQALIADQLQKSLGVIEDLVFSCVKKHQETMKAEQTYLLLPSNE